MPPVVSGGRRPVTRHARGARRRDRRGRPGSSAGRSPYSQTYGTAKVAVTFRCGKSEHFAALPTSLLSALLRSRLITLSSSRNSAPLFSFPPPSWPRLLWLPFSALGLATVPPLMSKPLPRLKLALLSTSLLPAPATWNPSSPLPLPLLLPAMVVLIVLPSPATSTPFRALPSTRGLSWILFRVPAMTMPLPPFCCTVAPFTTLPLEVSVNWIPSPMLF